MTFIHINLVNCEWGTWGQWGICSRTCGGGYKLRSRTHDPPASNGGKSCSDSSQDEESCNTYECTGL